MPAPVKTLASYIPAAIARRLAANPRLIIEPTPDYLPAAILAVDISGLNRLAVHLTEHGILEELATLLKVPFQKIVDLLTTHGGDVVKFSGDMLFAIWPTEVLGESLEIVTLRAAQCGLAMQEDLHNLEITDGLHLSLKISIGAGDVLTTNLGGVYGRWEFLATGQPVVQIIEAGQQALPQTVVLSPEAWTVVESKCEGDFLTGGYVRLKTVKSPVPIQAVNLPTLTSQAEAALRGYIPGAFLSRLGAVRTSMFAELLPITVLYVHLPDLSYTVPTEQTHDIVRALQTALYEYEGSVDKISMDNNGTYLTSALGLPPVAHEDDAVLGVRAAIAMQKALGKLNLRGAIGVTTGRTFCGIIGNEQRREYTIIGEVVSLAAELSQRANEIIGDKPTADSHNITILCDPATYEATREQITYETLPAIQLKTTTKPITIYQPLEILSPLGHDPHSTDNWIDSEMYQIR